MKDQVSFERHVRLHFDFLVSEYGYRISRQESIADSSCVEYCNDHIYVRILKAPPDFEPYFIFGKMDTHGTANPPTFDWVDVGNLNCCGHWQWQRNDDQPFSGRVVQLARLLRDCGGRILRGDKGTFDEMIERRNVQRGQHLLEETARLVRSQVEDAWRDRRYDAVIELYNRIATELSEVEQKRLAYATKKMANSKE